jgi:hypothetical protein
MTIVINLIGSPGVGKSVIAAMLFAELKMLGHTVEYVPEYVKSLVWKGDLETIKNQYYVSAQQYKLLKAVNNKVDYIVTDGSLFLGLYYNRHWPDNVSDIEKTDTRIKEYLSEFENIYIFLKRGDFPYEREGRIHTEEESWKIEDDLEYLLQIEGINYKECISSKNDISDMLEYVHTSLRSSI